MIFCTLFNSAYLLQGIALYHSLERVRGEKFTLYVLCMDDFTYDVLAKLRYPSMVLVSLQEIEDDRMRVVRSSRTVGEYCWTCTTPWLLYLMQRHSAGTVITYVDADLYFYSDPIVVLEELGNGSILIHEHDFAPEHATLEAAAGRFNVGLAAFRNDDEGRRCLERWMDQCLDECVMDPLAGKCGDQNYLDEWPELYSGLVISSNPGVGLAPWNVSKHRVRESFGGPPTVDGQPVVFYHYHSTRPMRRRSGIQPVIMVQGDYRISPDVKRIIYLPYAASIWASGKSGMARLAPTVPAIYHEVSNQQILFILGPFALPKKYNPWMIKTLYGIDPNRDDVDAV